MVYLPHASGGIIVIFERNLKIILISKPQITLSKRWNGGLIIQVAFQHLHK
jgi:hypothetical protein